MDLDRIKLIIRNREFIPVAVFIFMDLVLIAFVVYLGIVVQNVYQQVEEAQIELEAQEGTATLIKSNQQSMTSTVEEYNDLLNALIPDDETYFNVIAAFEKLGQETGVSIDSYTINLDQTTEQKLSLELNVTGDQDSLLRLIRDYNYASGRLLTNEGIDISLGNSSSLSFAINLVHAPFEGSRVDTSVKINPDDIAFMEGIRQRLR